MHTPNFIPLLESLADTLAAEDVVTGTECYCVDEELMADWTVHCGLFVVGEVMSEGGIFQRMRGPDEFVIFEGLGG